MSSFESPAFKNMSMSGSNIRDLLRQTSARAFDGDDNVRLATIREAQRMVHRLQHPTERGWELAFENWAVLGALQTFIDLGIFERWHAAGGGQMSLEELCGLTKSDVDPKLLVRLCRLLAAKDFIEEVSEEQYKPTEFGLTLGDKDSLQASWVQSGHDHFQYHGLDHLSRFLQETSYRNPVDMGNTSFQAGCPENTEFWARCSTKPELQASFSEMMENWTRYKTHWTEYFDSRILLSCELDPSAPILVDVGGNRGHDLSLFLERHRADVPAGSLLLQDRPEALALAEVDQDKIRIMPHDFLTPQPVLGARAYMFHAVFHDWSDEMSLVILKHTATAMKRGYSRLLIVDVVLPPTGASAFQAGMDVSMMGLLSSKERTQGMWEELFSSAGFKILKIWKDPKRYESVIEAELIGSEE
ncbi:S-adenosyl-L-methionine-dependent methyltransferase [Apiospora arundinis]